MSKLQKVVITLSSSSKLCNMLSLLSLISPPVQLFCAAYPLYFSISPINSLCLFVRLCTCLFLFPSPSLSLFLFLSLFPSPLSFCLSVFFSPPPPPPRAYWFEYQCWSDIQSVSFRSIFLSFDLSPIFQVFGTSFPLSSPPHLHVPPPLSLSLSLSLSASPSCWYAYHYQWWSVIQSVLFYCLLLSFNLCPTYYYVRFSVLFSLSLLLLLSLLSLSSNPVYSFRQYYLLHFPLLHSLPYLLNSSMSLPLSLSLSLSLFLSLSLPHCLI